MSVRRKCIYGGKLCRGRVKRVVTFTALAGFKVRLSMCEAHAEKDA